MKTVAGIALVGVALSAEDHELFRPSTFRPVHKIHTNDVNVRHNGKKVSQFDDNEFFGLDNFAEHEFGILNFLKKKKKKKQQQLLQQQQPVETGNDLAEFDDNELFGLDNFAEHEFSLLNFLKKKLVGEASQGKTEQKTKQDQIKARFDRIIGKISGNFKKEQLEKMKAGGLSTELADEELFDIFSYDNELMSFENGRRLNRENLLKLTKKILLLKEDLKKIDLELSPQSDNELIRHQKQTISYKSKLFENKNRGKNLPFDLIKNYKNQAVAFEGVDNALHSLGTLLSSRFEIQRWHEERERKVEEINTNILFLKELLNDESEVTFEELVDFFEDSELYLCFKRNGRLICPGRN